MKRLLSKTTIGTLALILPIAALANISGTPTLSSGQTLSLDTGTVGTSGGDILLGSSGLTLQGTATGFSGASFGFSGMSTYNTLVTGGASTVSSFGSLLSSAPIPNSSLTVDSIFVVKTNGGNFSVLIVTASSAGSLGLQFTTFISTVPTITQVINNYSLIPGGFVNSGISPGSLFIIKGSLLASATSVTTLQSTTGGSVLPTTLNGATVAVTVGSVTVAPAFYYAENVQLALVLPSNTPIGAGTVTVTYNNQTSAPFSIQVVKSAFGFAAYYGAGSGVAHAQDLNYGYYTYINSIPQGSTIRLIGSGLGADPTRDTQYVQPTAASAINALAHIYVGGVDSVIFYQGPEGYPGVDEVDVTIPASAPSGCNVSIVGVSTSGVPTNFLTLPIGTGVCQDAAYGINGSEITNQITQTNYSSGVVELFQSTSPSSSGGSSTTLQVASADFTKVSGTVTSNGGFEVSIGGCIVFESGGGSANVTTTGLNAGTITVSGAGGTFPLTSLATLFPQAPSESGFYETINASGGSTLPAGYIPTTGGTFTFTGTGGTDVGPFMTQVVFPNPILQWTNQAAAATVTRSAGQLITWTGGSAGTYVSMTGSSSSATGSLSGTFTCIAPVGALQFTVPSYVLAALPAGTGNLAVGNSTVPVTFSATGINYGSAIGGVSYSINATYQ
jgi:uncharacterized protein (TIGR03437 family)